MAEIKRTFASGRMNKDLDERLVPNGEYRDAQNIQVRTTDSSAAGTVQNLQGNLQFGQTNKANDISGSKCVGSIADEKNNTAYFLFASDDLKKSSPQNVNKRTKFMDFILEYDKDRRNNVVFADVFAIKETYANAGSPTASAKWISITVSSASVANYKVGMSLTIYNSSGNPVTEEGTYITQIDGTTVYVNKSQSNALVDNGTISSLLLESPRILGLKQDSIITGINIIDRLIYFTSDTSEPRQINIDACKAGVVDEALTTENRIRVEAFDGQIEYNSPDQTINYYIGKELTVDDVTVIKKAPKVAPSLSLFSSKDSGANVWEVTGFSGFLVDGLTPVAIGSQGTISGFSDYVVYASNDILDFTSQIDGGNKIIVTVRVVFIDDDTLTYKVLAIDPNIQADNTNWSVSNRNEIDDIFKYKFPRFAFRYKYDNNEYSSFSPFSEIAFLPGTYTLDRKEGYNLSMVNRVSRIEILNTFSDELVIPKNVKCIDILYKSTDSPSVYLVKTLERDTSPEWANKANISITTEMVNQIIPDNQILRAWDNVPRTAKAQELVGNRLVYGNFTQGYDIPFKPLLSHTVISDFISNDNKNVEKSIKSMRTYKLGVVYGDRYGRETPVIALGTRDTSKDELNYSYGYDNGYVTKSLSVRSSRFQVAQNWETQENSYVPPSWMEYVKYYVKENSSEYYNLLADRWYDSGDGNLWISFPSADRNKIDEDTYLILKKASNSNTGIILDYKYKVLAIENEAPEFIKTSFGEKVEMSPQLGNLHWTVQNTFNNGLAAGVYTDKNIYIPSTSFVEPPADAPLGRKIRAVCSVTGTLIGNVTISTPYVNISSILPQENNLREIILAEPWGSMQFFADRLVGMGAYANIEDAKNVIGSTTTTHATFQSNAIKIEIVTLEKNDSPEYQGRFFVKLHRDSGLQYAVVSQVTGETEYQVKTLSGGTPVNLKINYIDTNYSTHPSAGNGHIWGSTFSMPNGMTVTELGANCSTGDDDEYWWSQYSFYGANIVSGPVVPPLTYDGEDMHNYKVWLDGARYRENSTAKNVHALQQSANANGNFFDKMTISFLSKHIDSLLNAPSSVGSGASFGFASKMDILLSVGTIFGFDEDPSNQKYIITDVETEIVSNFATDLGCADCLTPADPQGNGDETRATTSLESWLSSRGPDETTDISDPTGEDVASVNCGRVRNVITFVRLDDQGVPMAPGTGIDIDVFDPREGTMHDGFGALNQAANVSQIDDQFLDITVYEIDDSLASYTEIVTTTNPAVFETEPKESTDLELYYEASSAIPQRLDKNSTAYFAPVGCRVSSIERDGIIINLPRRAEVEVTFDSAVKLIAQDGSGTVITNIIDGDVIVFEHSDGTRTRAKVSGGFLDSDIIDHGSKIVTQVYPQTGVAWSTGVDEQTVLTKNSWDVSNFAVGDLVTGTNIPASSFIKAIGSNQITIDKAANAQSNQSISIVKNKGIFNLDPDVYKNTVDLPWFNCYSYGNGVESNRIRDDFNAPIIDNGVKVSSTFTGYKEDEATNRLIYSGIYNANSNTNNLNEFNMAEKITKDLNPDYGSIQALKTRDTDLIAFTEDKVLRILANKDALFNADGNSNLTATDRVLGQAVPYVGDYGISKNPESLASDQFRIYFTDKQRGAVLRLSRDGLTPISNVGMRAYFRDYLKYTDKAIGSFDVVNGEYNLTLKTFVVGNRPDITVSFNEASKGWVSFKTFIQDSGVSIGGEYLTTKSNAIWKHYSNRLRNNFYGSYAPSTITAIINDMPGSIKKFKTISYEGSEGKSINVNNATSTDPETGSTINVNDNLYDSLTAPSDGNGWSASIKTDLQEGLVNDFRDKENKWYGFIIGEYDDDINSKVINTGDFTTQGIGSVQAVGERTTARSKVEITIQN